MQNLSTIPNGVTRQFESVPYMKTIVYSESAFYEESKEEALFIGEERGKYVKLLDMATEQFNKELEDIEKRCYDPTENPEELGVRLILPIKLHVK
jgi:hypothetical protein